MATNTAASFTNHTGNGTAGPFSISFSYLSEAEVDVTVGGVLKTIITHYTFTSATQITFTSGNEPGNGVAIKFQRDTNITAKKVDFNDGSVLTESDLDTQNDQVLFAQQEILDKLSGIEENATADQTDAEIRTAVGNATDSNVFTDADHSKLNAIEASATADQTNAEIKTAYEANSDTNAFTDAEKTKLSGIETSATADQSDSEIKTAYESNSDTNAFTDAEKTKLSGIATGAEVNVQSDFNATSGDAVILNKPTIPSSINDLSDVNTSGVANGKILKYDSSTSKFIIADDDNTGGGGGGGSSTFVGLSDTPVAFSGSGGKTVKVNAAGNALEFVTVSTDVVDDSSPQLAANLDVQTHEITTSTTNGNLKLNPNGTGVVEIKGDGTSSGTTGAIQLNCSNNNHGVKIQSPPHSAGATYTLTLPNNDGDAGQFLKTDGSGVLSFDSVAAPQALTAPNGQTRILVDNTDINIGFAPLKFDTDPNNTFNIKIQGPTTLTKNSSFTLPEDGSNGQFLKTNGSGVLSFGNVDDDKISEGNTEAEVVDTGSDGHFKVTTEGTEKFRVAANGNVGIGSNSPSELLQVYDASGNPTINVRANNQNTASLKLENDDGDWTISSGTSSYPLNFAVGGSNKLTILNDGKVGIGDTTPSTELEVNGTVTATSYAGNGSALTGIASANRNLIINGAYTINQRGVTGNGSSGYQVVDRWTMSAGGLNNAMHQYQVDITAGDLPYTKGFRKMYRLTNDGQNADANDFIQAVQHIEAQNVATSGWNYVSSSSNITLSFYVRASVTQTYHGYLQTLDGTNKTNSFSFALTANDWTKVTKTFSGNSGITINNDNGAGLTVHFTPFMGTDFTASSVTDGAWQTYASGARTKDQVGNWMTTAYSTFEITGVQLEVGSVATDFEHRSFGQELALCQRYFYQLSKQGSTSEVSNAPIGLGNYDNSSNFQAIIPFPVTMRNNPSLISSDTANGFYVRREGSADFVDNFTLSYSTKNCARIFNNTDVSGSAGVAGNILQETGDSNLAFNAEL